MNNTPLNEYRKKIGMSVDEVAERANLAKSTVQKVLFGVVEHPRIDTLQAIERALGISSEPKEETKELVSLIEQLTEEEVQELSNFIDFMISKRK
jgi:transcriptional regulator with XRE-family HTH domain